MTAAVAKLEPTAAPAVVPSETGAIFSMIERMATDPNVSIDRVEQAFAFYQKVQADQARRAYYAAFAEMQPKLPVIEKRGTIKTNEKRDGQRTGNQVAMSKYALWEDIVEKITPILAAHGFALAFKIDQPSADRVAVTGILSHCEGHSESTSFALPIDSSGSKNNVQGWGSSVSYGKRYTGSALLNIVARGEDDDGKAAAQSADDLATISEEQQKELSALLAATNSDLTKFLEHAKAEALWDIMAKDFPTLKALLEKKKREGKR